MAKKMDISDIDSVAIINAFRSDDMSIPKEARGTGQDMDESAHDKDESVQDKNETIQDQDQAREDKPETEPQSVPFPAPVLPVSPKKEKEKEKEKRGVGNISEYKNMFIRETHIKARNGRQVYIRKEYHDQIQKILHVIGANEVSITGFIDNVLTYHFAEFHDEIFNTFDKYMKLFHLNGI
ncbi:MAG: DUF3408 domain-containing protein [Prevotella sp.]|nr:DUF3408 domain-containing protein [Prevotella sp.]